jgi:hypothetical protein
MKPSREMYVYLVVLKHYAELAGFGGQDRQIVARISQEIIDAENTILK